uniref:CSON008290 protein n=1 Tax=Culicoides sonorensis TaxID=179676 RepID=A0A336MWL1_CULSO
MKPVHRQYYAAFCANLPTILYGIFISWSSPNIPLLQSIETPLESPLNDHEASWIAAVGGLGGLLSTFICGWLLDKIGRKKTLILIGVPQALCWILILTGRNGRHLLIARILGGLSGGGAFTVVPVFISEISDDDHRGVLGTIFSVSCNFGIMLGFILSTIFDYYVVPLIVLSVAVVYLIGILFVRESPKFLEMQGKNGEEIVKSSKYYTGKEIIELELNSKEKIEKDKKTVSITDFKQPSYWKPTILSLITITFCTTSGTFVIICFTKQILDEAGSDISSDYGSIFIAFIQLLGSYCASIAIERAGRKPLLLTSAVLSCLSLTIMGSYYYLKSLGYDEISTFSVTPLVCVSFLFFIVSIGVSTVPMVYACEILPTEIRGFIFTLCMAELWTLIILGVRYFMTMVDVLGMHGFLWFFASTSLLTSIFIGVFLPETKGKSIEAIAGLFSK